MYGTTCVLLNKYGVFAGYVAMQAGECSCLDTGYWSEACDQTRCVKGKNIGPITCQYSQIT